MKFFELLQIIVQIRIKYGWSVIKYLSNFGQILINYRSNIGQILIKYWSNIGQLLIKFWQKISQIRTKYWSSTDKIFVKFEIEFQGNLPKMQPWFKEMSNHRQKGWARRQLKKKQLRAEYQNGRVKSNILSPEINMEERWL